MKGKSLQECFNHNVQNFPTQTVYRFIESEKSDVQELNLSQLYTNSKKIAAYLQENGRPGDRVLLLFPPGLDFCNAIWACFISGFIAVPVPLNANINSIKDYLKHIQNDCSATFLLMNSGIQPIVDYQKQLDPELELPEHIACADELLNYDKEFVFNRIEENCDAVLQYTSGSVSKPKGVILSHKNIVENILAINRVSQVFSMHQGVTWLPHFHDMGLIGTFLLVVISSKPGPLTFLSPLTFIEKPLLWLKLMSELKGEISVAPNFAFEICTKGIADGDLKGLDLSNWKVALCGSEAINNNVIKSFIAKFEKYGFKESSIVPCYGLAEATLLVAAKKLGETYKVMRLSRKALQKNRIEESKDKNDEKELVSCGGIEEVADVIIKTHDSIYKADSNARKIGEIYVAGASVAKGYFNKTLEANADFNYSFGDSKMKYFKTGDLGFFSDNELYVTGRIKHLIIIRGKNFYPYDIEDVVYNADESIRKGCVAAFSIESDDGERLVLVCELKRKVENPDFDSILFRVQKEVSSKFGISAAKILFVKTNSIDKTTSGKLQRLKTKRKLLEGSLKPLYTFEKTDRSINEINENDVIENIKDEILGISNLNRKDIKLDVSLFDLGIESVHLPKLLHQIKQSTGRNIIIENWILEPTINNLIKQLYLSDDATKALQKSINVNKEKLEIEKETKTDFVMPDFTILED